MHGAKPEVSNMSLRITEIPPNSEYEKLRCPYCNKVLQVGVKADGACDRITTVCKNCKRTLVICTD